MDKKKLKGDRQLGRLTCTIPEACSAVGCQRSTLYREAHLGRIKIRKMGRKSFLLVKDVEEWIERLPVAHFKNRPETDWLDD